MCQSALLYRQSTVTAMTQPVLLILGSSSTCTVAIHKCGHDTAVNVTTKPMERSEGADVCARLPDHHIMPLWLSLGIVEEQATSE